MVKKENENKLNRANRKTDSSRSDFLNAIHQLIGNFIQETKAFSKDEANPLVGKWIFKIKTFFLRKPIKKEDNKLAGRIHELDNNAKDVLKVLTNVREDLKKEVDGELYTFVNSVMKPMIRDVERVKNIVKTDGAIHSPVSAFNKYNQWIDNAKLFVQVCSSAKNKDEISQAVVKHTLDDFMTVIDRDLQLVEDYQEHLFSEVQMSREKERSLKEELERHLKFHKESLENLKKYPDNLDLESLNRWRDVADQARDFHFNTILQIIDCKIEDLNPNQSKEHHTFIENLEQIAYLETEIPMLAEKLEQNEDPFELEVSFQQLLDLEKELEDLYFDIRVPQAVVDRLDDLREILAKIFAKIKSKNNP